MDRLSRILSRPTAKPYRNADFQDTEVPYLNDDGHVDFAPDDIENPQNWSTKRRSYVSICALLLLTNATFASSSPSGCFKLIAKDFDVSLEAAGLTITLFLLGYCFGPLVFAPLSEFYGRRYVFYATFFMYFAFTFLCAFAPNFGALLVGRFLAGSFVSAPLSNGPGLLADLWNPHERGNAMAFFSCMVWVGPALGPVISGFLSLNMTWRWSFYILLWLAAATLPLMFTIPETYAPIILLHKAQRIRAAGIPGFEDVKAPIEVTDRSLAGLYKVALTRPWIILFDTISFLCAIYMSLVYLLLYMLFSLYPIIFQQKRGWNAGVGELPLIGTVIGAVLGAFVILYESHRQAQKLSAGQQICPEDRLTVAMVGGIGFSASMFWLAWSGEYNSVHWIVPCLAGVFLSTSMMLIFVAYLNYLVDTYLAFAASAVAANTVLRSAVGAAAPLFTNKMFDALGVGPGGSLIGGLAALLAVIPFAFYRWGAAIRRRSRFAAATGGAGGAGAGAGAEADEEEGLPEGGRGARGVVVEGAGASDGEVEGGSARDTEKEEERGTRARKGSVDRPDGEEAGWKKEGADLGP